MNQPGKYDILLQRRADYSVLLQFKDSLNAVIDLTGWTVAAQVWDPPRANKYADFTVVNTDLINGQITLKLSRTDTETFPHSAVYDVLMEDTAGERRYYLEGTIEVSEGYTSIP